MAGTVEVGPWGSAGGGRAWRFQLDVGERLTKITIRSTANGVFSIQFSYVDINNISRDSAILGGHGGDAAEFLLAEDEFITGFSGSFANNYLRYITITSLSFTTNLKKYGPFGNPESEGTPFTLPVPKGSFVGFFGRCGDRLDSIGAILKSDA